MNYSVYKNTYSKNTKYIKTKIIVTSGEKQLEVNALWDTGATKTSISQKIIELFNLKPIGSVIATGHQQKERLNKYIVSLILPTGYFYDNTEVLSGVYNVLDIDVIIGLDIISFGDLHMDYTCERPVLTFRHPNDCTSQDNYIETELF